MIQDVDDTLKEFLVRKVPLDPNEIDIRFETPTADWNPGSTKPTVNLFLYDVRENMELRNAGRVLTRNDKSVIERRAPVRIDLSYLITAWTVYVADEHQLLGRLLATLYRYPVLPQDVLKGGMLAQPPAPTWVAQPERTPNSWDFWTGLNGHARAGINYAVTVAIEPYLPETHHVVTEKMIDVHTRYPVQSD